MECKRCGEEVDELVAVKVDGRKRKVCVDCAEQIEQDGEIADGALGAMRDMMGYKGKF